MYLVNVFTGAPMVKVITIMDDVYVELNRLKRSKNLSFSGAIRYLLKERRDEGRSIITLAGSISELDVDRQAIEAAKKGQVLVK